MTTRFTARLAVLTAGFVLAAGVTVADDKKEDKVPKTISEIMKKGHGAKGLLKSIGKEVKEGKWDEAKTDAELLKLFGEGLGKIKPEKGTDASWKKLTDKYKDNTAEVYKAVDKKEAPGAESALKKIGSSCKECHDSHK